MWPKLLRLFFVILLTCVVLFSVVIYIFALSLQSHEKITPGSVTYYFLVDNRMKQISHSYKDDFKYAPADGASPEVHTLQLYLINGFYEKENQINEHFVSLGFGNKNGVLKLGSDVITIEVNDNKSALLITLYIY